MAWTELHVQFGAGIFGAEALPFFIPKAFARWNLGMTVDPAGPAAVLAGIVVCRLVGVVA